MIVTDLDRRFALFAVAPGVEPGSSCADRAAGDAVPGYRVPIHALDLEFLNEQVICIADDHTIRRWIEIYHVTRTRRTARQPLALADGEQLDPVVVADEVTIDIVNFAAMKFVFAQMRPQKRLVIVAGNKTDLLAIDLVRDLQA